MADGTVTIDIDMPLDKLKSNAQLAENILKNLGSGAGSEMDNDFKKASDSVVSEAKSVKKDVDAELKKPTATITPKVDDSDAQKGTQKIITSLRKLPKEQKVKLDADAKKAGIDDFTSLLKKVPKKTQTEILAQAQKGEVIDYETLLKKLPTKVLTDVELNDNASDELRNIQKEAQNTESGFAHLKTVIAGSFIGGAVLSGVTAITDSLKDLVTEGASASDAMDKFRSTMQLGGFGEKEIKKTADEVMDYANKTVYDLDDISNTTAQLAANGIKDYMGLTEAAGNLNAQAGGNAETFKSVAMMLTQTAGAGKLTTENWNQLADAIPGASGVLQKAMKDAGAYTGNFRDAMADGQITADEFADAITKLGQTDGAKKAAESTKTFEGAIGNLQAAAVDGMKNVIDAFGKDKFTAPINGLGTIVQDTFSNITKTVKNNEKVIDAIGDVFSSVFGAIGNVLSMFATSFKANVAGVLNNKEVTQGVENFKKSFDNVMKAIEPIEQAIGGLAGALTGGAFSLAVDFVKSLAKGFGLSGDEADKAKGKMDFSGVARIFSTLSQALNVVLGFIKPVVKAVGEMAGIIAKSAFSTFVDVLNAVGKALGAAFDKLSPLIPALNETDKGVTAVSKHKEALEAVGFAIGGIGTAVAAIKGAKAIFNGVSAGITALSNATKIFTGVQAAFNAVMALNPIVLIVGAVIAFGIAIYEAYKHIKPFRDAVNGAWESLKSFGANVVKVGKQIYNGIVDGVSGVIKWIKDWANSVIKSVTGAWKNATKTVSKVWQDIIDAVVDVWNGLTKKLSKVWEGIKKAAEVTFKVIGAVILAPILFVVGLIVTAWKAVHKPLEAAWKAISKTASNVWNSIKKTTEKAWNAVKDTVVDIAQGIYKPVKKAWDKVVNFVSDLWSGMKKTASKLWNAVKETVIGSAEAIYKPVHKAFTKVGDWIGEKWNDIKKSTSEKWGHVKDTISDLSKKAKDSSSKYFSALKEDVGNKWDTVKSVTGKAWNGVSDYVGKHSENARKSAQKSFSALRDKMSEIGDSISKKWGEIWGSISKVVSDIWGGIKNTVKTGLNGVIDIMNAGVDGIDTVWEFFTGHKTSIHHLQKVHFDQGGVVRRHLSVINDGAGPDWKELVQTPDGGLFMSQERNWTGFLPEGSRVYSGAETKQIMNAVGVTHYATGGIVGQQARHFADGGIVGDVIDWGKGALSNVGSWIGDKIEAIEKFLKDPIKAVKSLISKATDGLYKGMGVFGDIAHGAWDKLTDGMGDWIKKTLNKVMDEEGGNPPGEGAKRWEPYVKKALEANGLPTTDAYVQAWLRQIQSESGGNERAIGGDDGLAEGNATGLLQTKPGTFRAYAFPGHGNIMKGYDNMLAAINYAKHRYGSDMLAVIGHGHGYANGGHVYNKQLAWIGEDGDEFVINNRKPSADTLLASAIKQRAEINPNSFSGKIAHIIDSAKFSGSNGYGVTPQAAATSYVANSSQSNSASVVEGDTVISVQLDSDTIARATYPKQKLMQAQEIMIVGNGGAIPVV
ncbi:tape measure protein [Ligilactobacillus apodemi]|uniref:tape measure protein n=1 Tax=Ligilactobacillus apodemi TaxID=307126 RepID=UPI00214B7D2D|nr:tape measure protein [Ligilactobacillus apodemi]MCR1902289.1 tape measure protein [Ligilactobacillus apodemi]